MHTEHIDGAFRISRKAENDFVTEMDLKSERLIREALLSACPEDTRVLEIALQRIRG